MLRFRRKGGVGYTRDRRNGSSDFRMAETQLNLIWLRLREIHLAVFGNN